PQGSITTAQGGGLGMTMNLSILSSNSRHCQVSRYTTIPYYGERVKAFVTLIKFASFPVEKRPMTLTSSSQQVPRENSKGAYRLAFIERKLPAA
ncbi:hypothetical protein, partial [Vibrio aestuarianus]|uniref:hypothetical protein n=1 Tax=Vibrio aestuarianus TaxID=28171 RepID=UPI00237CE7F0